MTRRDWQAPGFYRVLRLPIHALLSLVVFVAATDAGEALSNAPIHVAPHGRDEADGSAGAPVASPERAQELVRARLAHPGGDIEVRFAAGIWRLSAPLLFSAADGGNEQRQVRWCGAVDGRTVLDGSIAVDSWTETGDGAVTAPWPRAWSPRLAYLNSAPVTRARLPASGWRTLSGPADRVGKLDWDNTPQTQRERTVFTVSDPLPAGLVSVPASSCASSTNTPCRGWMSPALPRRASTPRIRSVRGIRPWHPTATRVRRGSVSKDPPVS